MAKTNGKSESARAGRKPVTPVDSARATPPGSDVTRPGAEDGHGRLQDLGPASQDVGIQDRFLRLPEVLEIIPISPSTWWEGVRRGSYPKGTHLSPRTVGWRLSVIEALCARLVSIDRRAHPDPADGLQLTLWPDATADDSRPS